MQKAFILLLIIWNSTPFASGNTTHHFQFLLGCQVKIPCQDYSGNSAPVEWFYKKDEKSKEILIFSEKYSAPRHSKEFEHIKIQRNLKYSLVIANATEKDEGIYWCVKCQSRCQDTQRTVISLKKDTLKETNKTLNVTAGKSFTHVCPGELTNTEWTFNPIITGLRKTTKGTKCHFDTSNKSLHIANVKREHAGVYTCWTKGCNGHKKLLTLYLCVTTEPHSKDLSICCGAMCYKKGTTTKPNSTLNVEVTVHPHELFNFSTTQKVNENITSLNETTDIPGDNKQLIVIFGTSATVLCLSIVALLTCYRSPRLWKAFPLKICCWGKVEEESQVVYSSIVIRGPARTTNNCIAQSYCVYSEIKRVQ